MSLPESSFSTYVDVTADHYKRDTASVSRVDISQASDLKLFEVMQDNLTPQARLYGAALVELCSRFEKQHTEKEQTASAEADK